MRNVGLNLYITQSYMQYYCTITHTNTHCSCSNIVTCDLNWTQRAFLTKNWGTKGREERTSPPLDCPLFWQRIESIVQYAAQQYTRVTTPQTDLHQTYSTGLHTQHDITASDRENTGTHPCGFRCSAVCLIKE